MPSKIKKVKISLGSTSINSQGFKYSGPGNWKSKHQVRGSIDSFPAGTGEDPAAPGLGRRKHETKLFITLNPNKGGYGAGDDAAVYEGMTRVVKSLARDETLQKLIVFGPCIKYHGEKYQGDSYAAHVEEISVSAAVERGDRQLRSHAHLFISMVHYSQVQISKTLLQRHAREVYNEGMPDKYKLKGAHAFYCHIKLMPQSDWSEVMQMYLEKGVLGT